MRRPIFLRFILIYTVSKLYQQQQKEEEEEKSVCPAICFVVLQRIELKLDKVVENGPRGSWSTF